MAARTPPRKAKKAARKKSPGAGKKKGNRKAARRKSERKKKAARRRTERGDDTEPDNPRKKPARAERKAGRAISSARSNHRRADGRRDSQGGAGPRVAVRAPTRIGFIRESASEGLVATIELERGDVQARDAVHILGPKSDHYERVEDLMVSGKVVATARAGDIVSLRVSRDVEANDAVYLLSH
jgi:hypothetical protein